MVAVTVQPAGLLVCFMIFITGRASAKGASRSAAMVVCSRPKAIRGKKMTPSILASFQGFICIFRASFYFVLQYPPAWGLFGTGISQDQQTLLISLRYISDNLHLQ